jgi:hypothetical protein
MNSNNIGDEGAPSISESLKVNTSITSTDMSWNGTGDEGTSSINESLKVTKVTNTS